MYVFLRRTSLRALLLPARLRHLVEFRQCELAEENEVGAVHQACRSENKRRVAARVRLEVARLVPVLWEVLDDGGSWNVVPNKRIVRRNDCDKKTEHHLCELHRGDDGADDNGESLLHRALRTADEADDVVHGEVRIHHRVDRVVHHGEDDAAGVSE